MLIHSASGGVGTALTQLAKLKNCQIIGLTTTSSKISYLKKNGVNFPIYHRNNNYTEEVLKLTKNKKINAIFNSVGGHTFKKDLELLDSGGHLVFFGISDRIKSRKGILNTLFQLLKIGKIHPAKLILNSQSINGLNLLEIADKKPEQIQNFSGIFFIVPQCFRGFSLKSRKSTYKRLGAMFSLCNVFSHLFRHDAGSAVVPLSLIHISEPTRPY